MENRGLVLVLHGGCIDFKQSFYFAKAAEKFVRKHSVLACVNHLERLSVTQRVLIAPLGDRSIVDVCNGYNLCRNRDFVTFQTARYPLPGGEVFCVMILVMILFYFRN